MSFASYIFISLLPYIITAALQTNITCDSGTCFVDCTQQDCSSKGIDGNQASKLIVHCKEPDTCRYTKIYSASETEITCGEIGTTTQNNIGCKWVSVFANTAHSLSFTAAPYGVWASYIYADTNDINALVITCIGSYDTGVRWGCDGLYVRIPADPHTLTLNCYGYGCWDLSLRRMDHDISNLIDFKQINWNLNTCFQCSKPYECLGELTTACMYGSITRYGRIGGASGVRPWGSDGYTCDESNDDCNCEALSTAFRSSIYVDVTEEECIFDEDNVLTCDAGTDCEVDCAAQSCSGQMVDGTLASSLTVDCDTPHCENTRIVVPNRDGVTSNVHCDSSEFACYSYTAPLMIAIADSNVTITDVRKRCSDTPNSCYDGITVDTERGGTLQISCYCDSKDTTRDAEETGAMLYIIILIIGVGCCTVGGGLWRAMGAEGLKQCANLTTTVGSGGSRHADEVIFNKMGAMSRNNGRKFDSLMRQPPLTRVEYLKREMSEYMAEVERRRLRYVPDHPSNDVVQQTTVMDDNGRMITTWQFMGSDGAKHRVAVDYKPPLTQKNHKTATITMDGTVGHKRKLGADTVAVNYFLPFNNVRNFNGPKFQQIKLSVNGRDFSTLHSEYIERHIVEGGVANVEQKMEGIGSGDQYPDEMMLAQTINQDARIKIAVEMIREVQRHGGNLDEVKQTLSQNGFTSNEINFALNSC